EPGSFWRLRCGGLRFDDYRRYVRLIELVQLDENDATLIADARRVPGADGIPDVGAGRVEAVLVAEHAFQHEELLAATMDVFGERAVRRVTHERGRPRHFLADAVEHHALNPRHRGGDPAVVMRADDYRLREIRVD